MLNDVETTSDSKPLKPEHKLFQNLVLKGEPQTTAYQTAYPGTSYMVAAANASRLMKKAKIAKPIRQRIQMALANANVTDAEILGAATRQARSSVADVIDENGNFDLKKAKKTGAIDFVKKIKTTKRITEFEGGTAETVSTEFEMLTNQDARKELANYLGLEKTASLTINMIHAEQLMSSAGLDDMSLLPGEDDTDNSGAIDVDVEDVAGDESLP